MLQHHCFVAGCVNCVYKKTRMKDETYHWKKKSNFLSAFICTRGRSVLISFFLPALAASCCHFQTEKEVVSGCFFCGFANTVRTQTFIHYGDITAACFKLCTFTLTQHDPREIYFFVSLLTLQFKWSNLIIVIIINRMSASHMMFLIQQECLMQFMAV